MSGLSAPLGIPGIPGIPAAASSRDRSRAPTLASQPSSSVAGGPTPANNAQSTPASSTHCTGSRGTALGARRERLNTNVHKQTSENPQRGRDMSRASPADSAAPTSVTVSMSRPPNSPPKFKEPTPAQPTASYNSRPRGERADFREAEERQRSRSPRRAPRVRATARPASSAGLTHSGARPSDTPSSYGPASSGPYARPCNPSGRAGRAPTRAHTYARPAPSTAPTSAEVPAASAGTIKEPESEDQEQAYHRQAASDAQEPASGGVEPKTKKHLLSTEHEAFMRLHEENMGFMDDYEEGKRDTSKTSIYIAKRSKFDPKKLDYGVWLIEKHRYGLKAAARKANVSKGVLQKYWNDECKHIDSGDDGSESDDPLAGAIVPSDTGMVSGSDEGGPDDDDDE